MTIEQGLVAKFSLDRKYRYRLTRRVGLADNAVTLVMLNPSTADETQNDPTIRRCIDFANRWGFGWLHVVNLSPLRSPDPKELLAAGLESDAVWAAWADFRRDDGMPIKNYTTKVAVERTVAQIMDILVQKGASEIMTIYGDNRKAVGLQWRLTTTHGPLAFSLPVNIEAVFRLITRQGLLKSDPARRRDQAGRVAWRNIKDWVEAQIALIEAEQVEMEEVFLPYVVTGGGTLYKTLAEGHFAVLLGGGPSHQLPEAPPPGG